MKHTNKYLSINANIFFPVMLLVLSQFSACRQDRPIDLTSKSEYESQLDLNDENYLVFPDQKSFEDAIKYIEENEGSALRTASGISFTQPGNFKSVSSLKRELINDINNLNRPLRGDATSLRSTDSSSLADLEEMTKEEFDIFKAEELLLEPAFYELMDTTMRVQISDTLYVVTEVGTFASHKNDKHMLYQTISDVRDMAADLPNIRSIIPIQRCEMHEQSESYELRAYSERECRGLESHRMALSSLDRGDEYNFGNNVRYVNSFGGVDNPYNDDWTPVQIPTYPSSSYDNIIYPEFHKPYNVTTEKWKNKTWAGKIWSGIVGKDIQRTNYFDRKHRVALQVYDVNYGFWTNAGIKVKFQERKKFLGIPYWKNKEAQKIALGFNYLHGVYHQKNPNTIDANARPLIGTDWKEFSGNIEKINAKFVHRIFSGVNIFKDWSNKICVIVPKIDLFGFNIVNPKDVEKMLYELPEKELVAFLNSNAKKYVLDPYKKTNFSTPPDPRIAYITYGNSIHDFSTKSYIMGVEEFSNMATKKLTLNFAIGLSFKMNGGAFSLTPFLPTTFDLKSFDLFGAVYYNGEWRGVRMVTE